MKKNIPTAFPGKLRNKFKSILNSLMQRLYPDRPYCHCSYSQEGEDLIIERFFGSKEKGSYVDIGAHHPFRFSNTYLFYKKGWRGINIDAMPGSMNEFNNVRPMDINVECPIGDVEKEMKYYSFSEPALNTFSESLADRYKNTGYTLLNVYSLKVKTLRCILDEYLRDNSISIDFMTIDAEGMELDILRSNDWVKYKPKLILVELLNMDLKQICDCEETLFLSEKGYTVFAKSGNTVFYNC